MTIELIEEKDGKCTISHNGKVIFMPTERVFEILENSLQSAKNDKISLEEAFKKNIALSDKTKPVSKNSIKWDLLNKEVWFNIDDEFGEITDFEIRPVDKELTQFIIHYRSGGEPKILYISDLKMLMQSFVYCSQQFSPIRKYTPAGSCARKSL